MEYQIEQDVKYTLDRLTTENEKVAHIRKALFEAPQKDLAFEDHWALREYLMEVHVQTNMLKESFEDYEAEKQKKRKFFRSK